MELADKQKEILLFLKKEGEQTETRICFEIHSSSIYGKSYLEDLQKKNLVQRRIRQSMSGITSGIFWKLTEEGENYVAEEKK
jgi:predicted ArsR family transcriptional regulator